MFASRFFSWFTQPFGRRAIPLCMALLFALVPLTAGAATIAVDGTLCSLPDAIISANTDTNVGLCTRVGAAGADTLLLSPGTHLFTTGPYDHNGPNATPSITTTVIISGGVAGATIERGGSDEFRLLHVDNGGDLTLQHVTVRNGFMPTAAGGGIYNGERLTLEDSFVISNTAENAGGIFNGIAVATIRNSVIASNTVSLNGGAMLNFFANVEIIDSKLNANKASNGGALYNSSGPGVITINGSEMLSNTVINDGGAIYNDTSNVKLSNSLLRANSAGSEGGAVFSHTSNMSLSNSDLISNTTQDYSGAVANYTGSHMTLENVNVISNTTSTGGGGLYNWDSSAMTITGGLIAMNHAENYGGGLANEQMGTIVVSGTQILSNSTLFEGGGLYSFGLSQVKLNNTEMRANKAGVSGGAIANAAVSTLTVTSSQIVANVAVTSGGGIYVANGFVHVSDSSLLNNSANISGSAAYQISGTLLIEQSCIVGNPAIAVRHGGGDPIVASDNWWGAPDGPSGAGPGSGDSVSSNVTFDPFFNSAPPDCPTLPTNIAFTKSVTPTGILLPGQPVTYTITAVNNGDETLRKFELKESLPAAFQRSQTIIAGAVMTAVSNGFHIDQLAPSQVATVQYIGKVDPTLTTDLALTNTATLSQALVGLLAASVSNEVVVPKVSWSSAIYTTTQESGNYTVTVLLAPSTPYTTVTAFVTISDSLDVQIAFAQPITFAPGSNSRQIVVNLDAVDVVPRTILLELHSPSGAALGSIRSAVINVVEPPASSIYLPRLRKQ